MQPVSPGAFRFYVAILAAAALASFAGAPPARAQQPAATSGGLAEVIVTAQKREQNLQEVGISLSAVSGSDLTDLGVVNATDITKSMPAVVLTQPNGDRKSTRLNSSHGYISYAVFCLKKKK